MKRFPAILLAAAMLAGCGGAGRPAVPILETVRSGTLEWAGPTPVLHLSGSPYSLGYQHGSLMRTQVRASVANIMAFADRELGILGLRRVMARRALDRAWRRMEPFVPDRYLEEMQGLADGAGIPLKTLQRVHALPDLTSIGCASFAAAGPATADGRLIHMRNLDWSIRSDVQKHAALFVVHPKKGRAFVNIGWLGFIGVISGVSEKGISVAEIGAESAEASLDGIPMPFLQRRILEEADDLKQAVALIRTGPRTVGYNYVLADAPRKEAVALETNRSRCAEFWMNREKRNAWSVTVPDVILRADWAVNPDVRDRQWACRGDPSQPGLESPVGSSAYDVRYRGLAALLERFHGRLDAESAMAIAAAVSSGNNIQTFVVSYPELWVATARGRKAASGTVFRSVDLRDLFRNE